MNRITGKILHTLQKRALNPEHKIPTWQKSKPNRGEGFAYLAKTCPESGAYNSDQGMASLDSGDEKPTLGKPSSRSGDENYTLG